MNTTDNARYREAAEYTTTVEAARKAAGFVTPANCLAYELKQYVAAYSQQIYSRENRDEEGPELLSEEHPDYPQRLADREKEGERQLSKIYALHGQELADEWAAARGNNPLDERLLLACLLKESAHRLLDGYADYLVRVGEGRLLPTGVPVGARIGRGILPVETFASKSSRMKERREKGPSYGLSYSAGLYAELDRSLIAAGAGAAELAHFHELLAAFHEREQGSSVAIPKKKPELIVIKSQAQAISEAITKAVDEAEAKANALGYTFFSEPKTLPVPASLDSDATGPVGVRTANRRPDQLTGDELALLCIYTHQNVTAENAKDYLEGNLTSGRALYNKFTHYSKLSNRIGFADETALKRENMIARIQKVLPRLNEEQKKMAENEIVILNGQN